MDARDQKLLADAFLQKRAALRYLHCKECTLSKQEKEEVSTALEINDVANPLVQAVLHGVTALPAAGIIQLVNNQSLSQHSGQ